MADETTGDKTAGKKKIGVSKSAPKSEARPLGTPAPKRSHKKKTAETGAEKVVDTPATAHVDSASSIEKTSNEATSIVNTGDVAHSGDYKVMAQITLTLDPKTRKSTSVVFKLPAGIRGSVRIAKTAFPGGVPPASIALQSDADNAFAEPKAKLTAEQRKEARKNAPKLTPAQKLAKLQERAAKLQQKIAAEAAAPAQA